MNASTAFPTDVTLSVALAVQNGNNTRNIMMGVIGLIFNIVAIFFLFLSKQVRPTLKITLLSMAFNDEVFMLSTIFWGFGLECWPILYIVACSILVSYFITSAIALHNYIAVFYPLRCRNILSLKRSLLLVLSCWLGGYAIALAFLGVRVPAGSPCFVMAAMSRPLIVVYSAICLLCCCFVTVASVKILACIRGRYRTIALRPLRNAQEQGQSALISINKVQSKRCRVNLWPFGRCTVVPMSENTFTFTKNARQSKISASISPKTADKPNQEYDLSTPKDVQKNHVNLKKTKLDTISEYVQSTSGQSSGTKCNKLIAVRPARQHNSDEEQSAVETSSWTREILQDGHHHKDAPYYVKSKSKPKPKGSDKNYLKGLKPKNCMDTFIVDHLKNPKKRCSHDSEFSKCYDDQKSYLSTNTLKDKRETGASGRIVSEEKCISESTTDKAGKSSGLSACPKLLITSDDEQYVSTTERIDSSDDLIYCEKQNTFENVDENPKFGLNTVNEPISTAEALIASQTSRVIIATDFHEHKQLSCSKRLSSGLQCIERASPHSSGNSSKKFPVGSSNRNEPEIKASTSTACDVIKERYTKPQLNCKSVGQALGSHTSKMVSISSPIQQKNRVALRTISAISPRETTSENKTHSSPCATSTYMNEGHPSKSFNTDSSVLSYPDTTDQIIVDRSANQSTPTLTRHQTDRGDKRWHFRTQSTLLILCSWCCFLSLPYIVYATYVAIWLEDRAAFLGSSVGMLCSSLVGLNSITNPLLYAWRFVEWRDIWRRIRRATSRQ